MATIQLDNIDKQFGSVRAIDDVSLTIADGEFLVLVGPSGCGKSTLLRTIAGLEAPTAGDVALGDRLVTDVDPKDRNVAMVFQNYALYPHMTARRNMTFGLNATASYSDEEIDRRVAETAAILDVEDLLDRKPSALSGGEKQRVAMGRALLRDPEVFLLDEPLSNLDAKLRDQMRAELQELHRDIGTTTVYVTHDQTEAMTLGERVAVMNDGHIEQVDPPQRLYDFPETQFVAEFIGSPAMNVLPVTVERASDGTWTAIHDEFRVDLPGNDALSPGRFSMGVRPEDLHAVAGSGRSAVHAERTSVEAERSAVDPTRSSVDADRLIDDPDRPPADLEGTVTLTEPQGDALLVHCDVGTDSVRVLTDSRARYEPGDSLAITADPQRLHLFGLEDGRAIYHSERREPEAVAAA